MGAAESLVSMNQEAGISPCSPREPSDDQQRSRDGEAGVGELDCECHQVHGLLSFRQDLLKRKIVHKPALRKWSAVEVLGAKVLERTNQRRQVSVAGVGGCHG